MFLADFAQGVGEDGEEKEDVLGLSVKAVNTEEGSTHAEGVSRSSPSSHEKSLCTVFVSTASRQTSPLRTHFSNTICISRSSNPRPFCTCPTIIRSKKFFAVALVGNTFSPCNA